MERIGRLAGKVAVVTGGTRGIGKAITEAFLSEGADVIMFGQNTERGDQVVKELSCNFSQGQVSFMQLDVSSFSAVKEAMAQLVRDKGGVDILINNAGITRDGLLMKMKEEDWDRVMEVNLKSCFNTAQALCRTMCKARYGRIINITSVTGLRGNSGQSNYAAAKAGMIGLSLTLAKELARRNITVNCVAPGYITTDMTGELSEEVQKEACSRIPMGRFGQPQEIARTVLFLASDDASYITGQVISVDGGM